MRKGAKRKTADASKASSSSQDNHKDHQQQQPKRQTSKAPRAKRVKQEDKPEAKTEYFEDQRSLEDLWKAAFPVGTEWDQLDSLYQFKWDFSNLEVVSPFPPSDKIGVNSVQREAEEIIPMKEMKMDWVPYIPLEKRDMQVERLKSQIYILGCTQRRSALRHLKLDRIKKYEYCLPYFYQPFKEDEFEQSTEVQIMYPLEPPVVCSFDWELDELEEFTDDLVNEEALTEDQKDAFKEFVKEKVREAKKANREAREARKKAIEEMSEETKAAFQKMRFYKFYPVQKPDTPDISNVKVPFINRYYRKAHEVL